MATEFLEQDVAEHIGDAAPLLESAVSAATTLRAQAIYSDGDTRLEHITDAWGAGGTVLYDGDTVQLARRSPTPLYSNGGALNGASVVLTLPDGSDPIADPASVGQATAARLVFEGEELATWSADDGLSANKRTWRRFVLGPRRPSS